MFCATLRPDLRDTLDCQEEDNICVKETYLYVKDIRTRRRDIHTRKKDIHIRKRDLHIRKRDLHYVKETRVYMDAPLCATMGLLRLVGSLKLLVASAEYRLFYRSLLRRRPMNLRSQLVAATP